MFVARNVESITKLVRAKIAVHTKGKEGVLELYLDDIRPEMPEGTKEVTDSRIQAILKSDNDSAKKWRREQRITGYAFGADDKTDAPMVQLTLGTLPKGGKK